MYNDERDNREQSLIVAREEAEVDPYFETGKNLITVNERRRRIYIFLSDTISGNGTPAGNELYVHCLMCFYWLFDLFVQVHFYIIDKH